MPGDEVQDRRPVYVEWVDSTAIIGWLSPRALAREAVGLRCETFGFLVHEDEEAITVSSSISLTPDGKGINSSSDPMTIPRCAIRVLHHIVF